MYRIRPHPFKRKSSETHLSLFRAELEGVFLTIHSMERLRDSVDDATHGPVKVKVWFLSSLACQNRKKLDQALLVPSRRVSQWPIFLSVEKEASLEQKRTTHSRFLFKRRENYNNNTNREHSLPKDSTIFFLFYFQQELSRKNKRDKIKLGFSANKFCIQLMHITDLLLFRTDWRFRTLMRCSAMEVFVFPLSRIISMQI